MKKKLILITLYLLFAFSSSCIASSLPSPPVFNYTFVRLMSENYVLNLKEKYATADAKTDSKYIDAKLKYQIAAAKFNSLKSMFELSRIKGKSMTSMDEPEFMHVESSAFDAYFEFEKAAQTALNVNVKTMEISEDKSIATIVSVISMIKDLQEVLKPSQAAKEQQLNKFDTWLKEYYEWPDWYSINPTKEGQPSKSSQAMPGQQTVR